MAIRRYSIDLNGYLVKDLGINDPSKPLGFLEVTCDDAHFPQNLTGREKLIAKSLSSSKTVINGSYFASNEGIHFLTNNYIDHKKKQVKFEIVSITPLTNQDTGWRRIKQTGKITTSSGSKIALTAYAKLQTGFVRFRRINDLCFVSIGGGQYDSFSFSTQRPAFNTELNQNYRWNLLEIPVGFRILSTAFGFITNDGKYINGSFIITSTSDNSLVQVKNMKEEDTTSDTYLKSNIIVYPASEPFPEVIPGIAI